MKKLKLLLYTVLAASLILSVQSCDDDEKSSASFQTVFQKYSESEGTKTIVVPMSVSGVGGDDIQFQSSGTATEGQDFEILGWTAAEGLSIRVIDDDVYESEIERAKIKLVSNSGVQLTGNTIYELIIETNCDYKASDFNPEFWAGDFNALEDYGDNGTYGPYHLTITQDEEDPTKYWLDNFYDSELEAFLVFDVDNNTVSFPDQEIDEELLTASSGTYDQCTGEMVINLNYDGSDWVYSFKKQ